MCRNSWCHLNHGFPWGHLILSRSLRHPILQVSQLGFGCRLAEGAIVHPIVCVTDGDTKQHWSLYGPEGHHLSPISIKTLSSSPLPSSQFLIHPIVRLSDDLTESVPLQFREKGVEEDCVKGLSYVHFQTTEESNLGS